MDDIDMYRVGKCVRTVEEMLERGDVPEDITEDIRASINNIKRL